MPFIQVDNLTTYFEEHGDPGGTPLVLLHNFTGTGASVWSDFYSAFGAYRLIVPDWRGHGRTVNPDGPAAMNHRQFARDISGLVHALELSRPILCGLSSGAMMLLSALVTEPDLGRALIFAGGTHYLPETTRKWMRAQVPEALSHTRIEQLQALHREDAEHWMNIARAFVACADRDTSEDYPSKQELRGISLPTLVVHGDRDPLFPVEIPTELYSLLPDSELCVLPNATHLVQRSSPQLFAAVVLDFLDRRCGGGTSC